MITPALPPEFDRGFRDAVRASVRTAYRTAERHYAPDDGADAMVHALVVYKKADREFRRMFKSGGPVAYVPTVQGPELRIGDKRLRWNKVGRTPAEQIDESLPRRSLAVLDMARRNIQLELPFSTRDRTLINATSTDWIIAHIGTPRGGLARIYLAAPVPGTRSGQNIAWRECHAIYDAARPAEDLPMVADLPEAIPLDPFNLTFREAFEAETDGETEVGGADAE